MDAIVLAGGEGTRLRPLTSRTPKQLVPVLGRPLLGHLLAHLCRHGVDRVALAVTRNPASGAVQAAFEADPSLGGSVPASLDVLWAFEDSPLGSGGAIANAREQLDGQTGALLVCNGDLITDIDVTAMLAEHQRHGAAISIALAEVSDPAPFGVVALAEDGRITRFVEKPPAGTEPSNLVNAGFWLLEPAALSALTVDRPSRVEDGLFPQMAEAREAIFGFIHRGYWRDVGDRRAYLEVNLDLLDGALDAGAPLGSEGTPGTDIEVARDAMMRPPVQVAPGTRIGAGTSVGRSAIGAGSQIADSVTIEDSVLWERVRVGAGARIRRSVLADDVYVGAGAILDEVVAAHGVAIPDGAVIEPGTALDPTSTAGD
jgi:NDP-sugar pyrophosphorylase family protein